MNRVFISYSRRNKSIAERIARDLSDAGMDVWVDWRQIQAGEFWQDEIFRGIERSEIVVVCLSPSAVKSEWVQREVNTANDQGKIILPVMIVDAYSELRQTENMKWLANRHWIHFEGRYEQALPELLGALPGKHKISTFDVVDVTKIPNPFKGLEAFQQTDADFFFGRERLIEKSLQRLRQDRPFRFLGVVGASGSGKSSLVRAGVIPALREGKMLPGSEHWRIAMLTPSMNPVDALARRLAPLIEDRDQDTIEADLRSDAANVDVLIADAAGATRLLLVVDQFEEVFTRASQSERDLFLDMMYRIITSPQGQGIVLITMRADFFDHIGHYPALAEVFEQENMVIVTEMRGSELLRTIEGPAQAVRLEYDRGLPQRILEDVQRQPGSLPLLQYALTELYKHREGNRLTTGAYNWIGGVQQALASHAETIYLELDAAQRGLLRRILLRLIEVSSSGEATRRRVARADLTFQDISDGAVQEVLDLMTAAESRLLMTSREIRASDDDSVPTIWVEVSHEALIREWDRFQDWVAVNVESLRYGSELLQSAQDWQQSNHDVAYLLTGNRLVRAEHWLADADATDLQGLFIQTSLEENEKNEAQRQAQIERELQLQRQSTTRLRYFVAVLVIALIVAVGLTGFALTALNRANESEQNAQRALSDAEIARATAVANSEQARSLALAARADRALRDFDGDLALLLAVEANEIFEPPTQSQRILSEVAYAPGTRWILDGHEAAVRAVAFSPDGSMALSADGNVLILWDTRTGEMIRRIGEGDMRHQATINVIDFSPNGFHAVSGSDDGGLFMWDILTGGLIREFSGHEAGITAMDFSPDGTSFVTGGADGSVIQWNILNGAENWRDESHAEVVNSVAFSQDGLLLLSASDDNMVHLRRASTGDLVRILTDDEEAYDFTAVSFNPTDSNHAAIGSDDNIIRYWNLNNGSVIRTMEGHVNPITDIVFTPNGEFILSSSNDHSVVQWQTSNGNFVNAYEAHTASIPDIDVASTQLASASFDGTVRVWDLERGEEISVYEGHSQSVVGVYGPDDLTVLSGSYDNTLRLWNTEAQLTQQEFQGHEDRISAVDISADGGQALSASWDDSVILWDTVTGVPLMTLTGHESNVQAVQFIADDTQAISSASNGGLIQWDLTTGEVLQRYGPANDKNDPRHLDPVYGFAVNVDETRLLSASADDTLILWDMTSGEVLDTLEGHLSDVRTVSFNADGTQAVSGASNGSIILWNVANGSEIRRFEGHDRTVFDVAFAPDDNSIVSGSLDNTIRLWDITNGFEIRRYETDSAVRSVDFSLDGRKLLTGMVDGTLHEWRLLTELNDLLAWTFANRELTEPTCADRQLFNITPPCDADGTVLERTPFQMPTATPTAEISRLGIGVNALVNTDRDDRLVLRYLPGVANQEVAKLNDGTAVTIVDGPVQVDGFTWWLLRTDAGEEGWSVESVPQQGIQTLVTRQ